MRIGDLAAAAGVAPSLVRYYEARGVIAKPARAGGARSYGAAALERLRRALIARRLGFSLAETKAALTAEQPWADVVAARLATVDDAIRRLRVQRALLRHAAGAGTLVPERYARVLAKIGA